MNQLHLGDNLTIMQEMSDASVDLICTDPPFNTGRDWVEFDDRWEGGLEGYLKFMKPRCEQMHRLLKDTGSLYLHCDPTADAYLRVMLDGIFGIKNFRNQIVWKRTYGHSANAKRKMPTQHDVILFYAKTKDAKYNPIYVPLNLEKHNYKKTDEDGRAYKEYNNIGKRCYLDESKGRLLGTLWTDIERVNQGATEETGYPTQKPVALYARMIEASSNQGDVVLDAFCGSGTTLVAANELGRYWIGIDKNETAINIAQDRLKQLNLFTGVT